MLTFFEYLRQRSFESVLAGAQEAVEFLEHQKSHNAAERKLFVEPPSAQPALQGGKTEAAQGAAATNALSTGSAESLPAPRRRGRPRKKVASGQ